MAMFRKAPKRPEEVFTPRRAEVNEAMYVPRPELEDALNRALRRGVHVVIHGESGCGKTWLYKKVLGELSAHYETINLADAARYHSITSALEKLQGRLQGTRRTGYSETKSAGVDVIVAKGDLAHEAQYEMAEEDALLAVLKHIRKGAGKGKPGYLVMENLESVIDDEGLLDELGNIITVLDDDTYAAHDVRIIIVGVPSRIRDLFALTKNLQTVANRLVEVPEVSRLTPEQTKDLIRRGFEQELGVRFEAGDLATLQGHVVRVTDRVPQRVHEYGLEMAMVLEGDNGVFDPDSLKTTDLRWLNASLSGAYTTIARAMNKRDTKVGRRNQVLFLIADEEASIRAAQIEAKLRRDFDVPGTTTLNIGQTLSDIAERGILRIAPFDDGGYIFTDPKYRMCLRVMLSRDPASGKVLKRDIESL